MHAVPPVPAQNLPQAHRVQVADGQLFAETLGRGLPIIFLHGWTLDARIWHYQWVLSSQFQVITLDRRGFGRSTAPPALTEEHGDIDAIADYFSLETFALVGLSQGATVALDVARRHPERVSALALIGAPLHGLVAPVGAGSELPRAQYAAWVRAGRLGDMVAHWRQHPLTRCRAEVQPLLDTILADYEGRDQHADQQPVVFSAADIDSLPMPVLALNGATDSVWRQEVARFIANHCRRGRHQTIADAGHLVPIDQPSMVNGLLTDLLTAQHHG